MKPNICPVTLISKNDRTRIEKSLFKVKLLALVIQLTAFLKRNFPYTHSLSANFQSNCPSEFLLVACSERLNSKAPLSRDNRVCSTDWLFCLLQYSVTLLKLDFTMDIFRGIFRLFWGEAISQYSSGWLLVKDLYLISEPNSFSGPAQKQLSKCNQRNTVIWISNQNLKSQEAFAKSCSGRKLSWFLAVHKFLQGRTSDEVFS